MTKRKSPELESKVIDDRPSEYAARREENIRRNQDFLASLGLDGVKTALEDGKPKKSTASKRGVSQKGARKAAPTVTRRSGRVTAERLKVEIEDLKKNGDSKLLVEKEALLATMQEEKKAASFEHFVETEHTMWEQKDRNSEPSLPLLEPYNLEDDIREKEAHSLITVLQAAAKESTIKKRPVASFKSGSSWHVDYTTRLNKLTISEEGVAKVVENRITVNMVHPSTSKLIIAAGDKSGNFGIWDVDNHSKAGVDGVYRYSPFVANMEALACRTWDSSLIYAGSRDGTVRTLDLNKDIFSLSFCAPESIYDVALHSFCFDTHGSIQGAILTGRADGQVALVDPRQSTSEYAWLRDVHDTKVNSLQQHPTNEHVVVSVGSGMRGDIIFTDIRKVGKTGKATSLLTLDVGDGNSCIHSRSINAAMISPDGLDMISVSQDNTVKLWKLDSKSALPHKQKTKAAAVLRHDNHTGRWLSTFHPTFDPKVGSAFVLGSMEKPRRMEVFGPTADKIDRMRVFKDDLLSAVVSRCCFHPILDIVVGGNSSGRCYVWR